MTGNRVLDSRTMRLGFRTIELRQEEDEWGRSFVFVVNGVPIFCKGANWVPADQFPARITDGQYKDLIQSAASANMNMLRVWGGGNYEDNRFYDLCDEYGILIWQDLMFACAHYPHDEEFCAISDWNWWTIAVAFGIIPASPSGAGITRWNGFWRMVGSRQGMRSERERILICFTGSSRN